MSLNVSPALQQRAQSGTAEETEFLECVRESLPYAWQVVSTLADQLAEAEPATEFVDHATPPPSATHRGQLLRAMASNAIRGSLERHFGLALAFQNCHRVAAFRPSALGGATYAEFTSPMAQLRNQSSELRDC